jgi:hypothetical protein
MAVTDGHHGGCGIETELAEFWTKLATLEAEIEGEGEIMI